ncbi:MAG: 3-methyl-2-oxobutanoate dehydrogenase subunit VorB [Defluviitaleaceae bacterium]|nr:3-methyl-2-oxobutanoate dehydrogenase subunit VorB [Defluviitaleaceae bacterium]
MKVLMKGNEAIAEGAIAANCRHYFGYPITPQSEIAAHMSKRMPKIGGTFLQAESEIAAINMVIGASAAGKRAMTSSSSPGVALKSEGLSYLAGCDLPAVVVNVQRGGPGLGGIQPSQSDYYQATRGAGHGDFHMLVLAPDSVQEMFDLTRDAFDLADRHRITAMVLADGVLGQMMEPLDVSEKPAPELPPKDWALTGTGSHMDGKKKRQIINSLYLEPDELERQNFARFEKYAKIMETETRFERYKTDDAEIVVVAYGAIARVAKNAVNMARDRGVAAGLFRPVTLWPFPKRELKELAGRARAFVTAEMSMGQMIDDVNLAIECRRPNLMCSRVGGMVHTPEDILGKIEEAAKL